MHLTKGALRYDKRTALYSDYTRKVKAFINSLQDDDVVSLADFSS